MPKAFINESNAKYQRLFNLYKQAYPDKRGDALTDEGVKIWREILEKGKNEEKYRLFLARGKKSRQSISKQHPSLLCQIAKRGKNGS